MKKLLQEKIFCDLFNVFASLMFFLLFHYCLSLTGENRAGMDEFIYFKTDSILFNLLLLFLALICLHFLSKLPEKLKTFRARNFMLAGACILSAAFSFYWVFASKSAPQADQLYLCQYADAFNRGDFSSLERGGYLARYPQQLGMVTLLRILFGLFGSMNYLAFQCLAAALTPLLLLSGCKVVRLLSDHNAKAEFYYLLFSLLCFPMYAYTTFVYGDFLSTVFGIFSVWMYLSCLKTFSWGRLALFGLSIGTAVFLRTNFLILVLAMGIVMLIKLLQEFHWQNLALVAALGLGCGILQLTLWGLYANKSQQDAPAIPALLYIVMGLNDDHQRAGWHNEYEYTTFAQLDDNPAAAKGKAYADLKMYLELYKNDPDYMVDFFVRKMNSQWNAPMYQSLIMNSRVTGEQLPPVRDLYRNGRLTVLLETGMKLYQLLLYGSILFLLIFRRQKFLRIEQYLPLIAVFGGFLFSLLWEAKTRYTFPWLLMQLPYMAMGVNELLSAAEGLGKKVRNYRSKSISGRQNQ